MLYHQNQLGGQMHFTNNVRTISPFSYMTDEQLCRLVDKWSSRKCKVFSIVSHCPFYTSDVVEQIRISWCAFWYVDVMETNTYVYCNQFLNRTCETRVKSSGLNRQGLTTILHNCFSIEFFCLFDHNFWCMRCRTRTRMLRPLKLVRMNTRNN